MENNNDLDNYFENFETACQVLADGDEAKKVVISFYYSMQRLERFERWGDVRDLEAAILRAKFAVEGTARGDRDFIERQDVFSHILACRYNQTTEIEDLEDAIKFARQVANVTPADHPNLAACLNNLGNKLESRYGRTGKIEDLVKLLV
ncbi:hypothetical protein LTS18_005475 [Coniosporium uncinatum]|uniref:Uncharacterized protein n=1 Tax=Coniosporium uncinatum TaxID=93489 RepID=A0ACC3DZN6_9PEZI|nr:hypothetical protein LTS18_005475 [Coniosporium uncinatum]